MKHWKAEIKERGRSNILTPELHADVDRNYCIEYFGLNEPDVEWYKLYEVK